MTDNKAYQAIHVKVCINNKFYSNYYFVDSFKLYDILENLWDTEMLTKQVSVKLYAISYYPNDKQRVDKFNLTGHGIIAGNEKKFRNLKTIYKYGVWIIHIKLIKDKEGTWKKVIEKIFIL